MDVSIRPSTMDDAKELLQLHTDVIRHDPTGLLRQPEEITEDFIAQDVLERSIKSGMIFVAVRAVDSILSIAMGSEDAASSIYGSGDGGNTGRDNGGDGNNNDSMNRIVGEIHAHTPPIIALRHLLTDTAIAVHPDMQGKGIGRRLFEHFLRQVPPSIARVELYTRENNMRNVIFYKSLGFVSEGPQRHKICMPNRQLQTPIHMAWFNPNFDIDSVAVIGE